MVHVLPPAPHYYTTVRTVAQQQQQQLVCFILFSVPPTDSTCTWYELFTVRNPSCGMQGCIVMYGGIKRCSLGLSSQIEITKNQCTHVA